MTTPHNEPVQNRPVQNQPVQNEAIRNEPAQTPHSAPGTTDAAGYPVTGTHTAREDVVAREKSEFGGMQFGTAFFGWLTATGAAVLLTALVAGAGAAVGLGSEVDPAQTAEAAGDNASTIGLVGAIALGVVIFVAYFAGGYVAGRMARFSGAKQGVAVWLWALIIAVVLAIVSVIAGSQFDVLADLNSFPRIPLNEGDLALGSIIAAVVIALVSLGGAVLGGVTGMRYHRKVDRVGLGR